LTCDEGGAEEEGVGRVVSQRPTEQRAAEAGSYLRLIDSCITQSKAQGPSRTCNESKEEEEEEPGRKAFRSQGLSVIRLRQVSGLGTRWSHWLGIGAIGLVD